MVDKIPCCMYNNKESSCEHAKIMGHTYVQGHLGTNCPFEGDVKKCNEDYGKIKFEDGKQVMAYLQYGIIPSQKIPFSELCLEGKTAKGMLLKGTKIYRPDGTKGVFKEDGTIQDLAE